VPRNAIFPPSLPLIITGIVSLSALSFGCRKKDDLYYAEAAKPLVYMEVEGEGIAALGDGFAIRIADGYDEKNEIPKRLKKRLAAGERWIVLKEPIVFSGAAKWLMNGKTPFVTEEASLMSAHDQRDADEGKPLPLAPALLVLKGSLPSEAAQEQLLIKRLENFDVAEMGDARGIKALKSETDRVAVGRGVETSMGLATGRVDDASGQSSYDWVATLKDDAVVADDEWIAAIDKTPEERRPYRALIRRYRSSVEPRITWFSVPLNVVLLCSQITVKPSGDRFHWTWEGFWMGKLETPKPAPTTFNSLTVRIVYQEYKSSKRRRRGGSYLSSFFDPVTRTGKTALDEITGRATKALVPTAE
jgi:hypothetical protein